ncbi:MAG TPA: TROVE domain-containing protein [Candidatus Paceibacterota bacterium]
MARLNTRTTQPAKASGSPMRTVSTPDTVTHEGAPAFRYEDRTALFVLGAGRFYNEDSFYESGHEGARRFVELVHKVAPNDPEWFKGFVRWLRHDGNIRTAAIVAAAEGAKAWQRAGIRGTADLVSAAIVRADEPGEFVAYYREHVKRVLGGGVRRALKACIRDLYTQRNVIKWDSAAKGYRFADVIDLVSAEPVNSAQATLFKYLLDNRHHNDGSLDGLFMLQMYKQFQERLRNDREGFLEMAISDPGMLRQAGMTWENLSSSGPMNAKAWEVIIPSMGYMALLRNLRNFDEANVSQRMKEFVAKKLTDPDEVARSRQLPYRFMSAYENAQGAIWQSALDQALSLSAGNIPALDGKTVVMVDTSGSMQNRLSDKSKMPYVTAAALFGVALAAKQEQAELLGFADGRRIFHHRVVRDAAVLRTTSDFVRRIGEDGHGTNIAAAVRFAQSRNAARIVIISDMQCMHGAINWRGDGGYVVPPDVKVPVYAFNMAGYGQTVIDSASTRHQLGGLSDSTFSLIKAIEVGQRGQWPWMK